MNQRRPYVTRLLVALAVVSLALAGCGATTAVPAAPTTPSAATQISAGGEVTVTATWVGSNRAPVFTMVLDTHSVDLDALDLTALATLSVGGMEVRPITWDAPAGGHHRAGVLSFPTTTADGRAVIGPETETIELVIRDVAGVPERIFRWTVTS